WHVFHDGTYRPIDPTDDYYVRSAFGKSANVLPKPKGNRDNQSGPDFDWDAPHIAVGWEMWVLARHPYFLRQWQFAVVAGTLETEGRFRAHGYEDGVPRPIVSHDEPRAWGKQLMLLVNLVKAMDGLPTVNWLQPKPVFDTMLSETGTYSQYLATLPAVINGNLPPSQAMHVSSNHSIQHADMQAIWSTWYAVHSGYTAFQDLADVQKAAYDKLFNAFGTRMTQVPLQITTDDKNIVNDLDAAIAAVLALPVDPNNGSGPDGGIDKGVDNLPLRIDFTWDRFQGMTAALSQYDEAWRPSAQIWQQKKLEGRVCHAQREWIGTPESNALADGLGCPIPPGNQWINAVDWLFDVSE
ncbi:MAG: hypothetical protein AAF337_11000, partial [Pseudomonadota bacterium]